jgi:hypothetical protein
MRAPQDPYLPSESGHSLRPVGSAQRVPARLSAMLSGAQFKAAGESKRGPFTIFG